MAPASCTGCGMTLELRPGWRTVQCPRCYAIVSFTPKIQSIQNYNSSPMQSNYGSYQPPRPFPVLSNRRRAVLIGVSYIGQTNGVRGSINDVRMMTHSLVNRFGFPMGSILVLTEEEMDPYRIPTKHNILMAMDWLLQGCQSGDSLVFFYSGHGSRVSDVSGSDELDGFDELLCPVDYKSQGKISDDEVNRKIVRPLPHGAILHTIVDTCRSGTLLDLPFMWEMNQQGWKDQRVSTTYRGTSGGTAICFSACNDHETSLDFEANTSGDVAGAMTSSFIQAVEYEGGLTYASLLQSIRTKIREIEKRLYGPYTPPTPQVPQLSSNEMFDVYTKPFML